MAKEQKVVTEFKDAIKEKQPDKPKKTYMIYLTFRETRKYDLHIGRKMETFRGRETKLVPEEWVSHKDFEKAAKLFIIKKNVGGKVC